MKKKTTIWIDEELLKQLKKIAIDENTSMTEIINKLVEEKVAKK